MAEVKRIPDIEFEDVLARTKFNRGRLTKDYFVTLLLYLIKDVNEIYFKGGTALNKIFLNHARLSEDIDFSLTREVCDVKKEIIEIIEKSESNLVSAKILLENNRLEESVSLTYYSMYHMLTALLFKVGIKCENHSASIILLKELFSIKSLDIYFAKKERIDKQYYTDFSITKQEVSDTFKVAENFNKELLDFISKLNNEEVKKYREKFRMLI